MTARDLSPAAEARVLPFRRPASAVRVRRRSPWLVLGRHFAQALVLVGGPLALGFWLFSSPTFAVTRFAVEGNRFVERAWVDQTLAPLLGANLLSLPLPLVEELLAANPWVEGVTVEKRLPNELRVALVERRPAALLRDGLTLVYLDGNGQADRHLRSAARPARPACWSRYRRRPARRPRGPSTWRASWRRSRRGGRVACPKSRCSGEGDFRLYLGALAFPLLVRAGTLKARLGELQEILPRLDQHYSKLAFIDLRFDRRIIFQPAL